MILLHFLCLSPLKQLLACRMLIYVSPSGLQAHSRGQRAHVYITISPEPAIVWLAAWIKGKHLLSASAIPSARLWGGHPDVAQPQPQPQGSKTVQIKSQARGGRESTERQRKNERFDDLGERVRKG